MAKIVVNEAKMQSNFEVTKDKILAEPLYIILALAKYADAYDVTMRLSRQSQKEGRPLIELANAHSIVGPILLGIPDEHKAILADTSLYVGDAARRTVETCEYWEREVDHVLRRLDEQRTFAKSRDANYVRDRLSGLGLPPNLSECA
jgi:adenylosuccinate lyase